MTIIARSIPEQAEELNLPDLMIVAGTRIAHQFIALHVVTDLMILLLQGVVLQPGLLLQEVPAVLVEVQVPPPEVQAEVHQEAEAVADAKHIDN